MTRKSGRALIGAALLAGYIFAGCATAQPMTQKIEKQVSAGAGDVKNFQYYISRNIKLTRTEDPVISAKVSVTGQIDVQYVKNTIQIAGSTEGELLKMETDPRTGNTIYYVAFEAENDNCLRFEQREAGMEEKLFLLYDDYENLAINYGGLAYVIDWDAGGLQAKADDILGKVKGKVQGIDSDDAAQPYLLVKMSEQVRETENYRKASGRKVGN
jgi:outer membrane murein-binding lipoprotein Lpp